MSTRHDIVIEAKRDVVLDFGPVTREISDVVTAINLDQAGTKLWFTVKESLADDYADAKLAFTWVQGQAEDRIVVSTPSSTTVPNGTITISDADIDVSKRTSWEWDLTLEEPSGRRETIDRGAFKVLVPVSDPA